MIHVNSQPEIPGITVKVVKGTIVGDRCQGKEVLNK